MAYWVTRGARAAAAAVAFAAAIGFGAFNLHVSRGRRL